MLLDQNRYGWLNNACCAVRQNAQGMGRVGVSLTAVPRVVMELAPGWPTTSEETRWRWECLWTSPVAAIVEVKQEVGPYDQLGEPSVRVMWRFMIYQWGQVFVHAQWEPSAAGGGVGGRPMTWALVQEERENLFQDASLAHAKTPEDADRLLNAIYPESLKDGLETALPHQMQRGASVAMIAKSVAASAEAKEKNVWWWARGVVGMEGKRIFGVGLGSTEVHSADCMLLVNKPTALMQAGSFSQYLAPPKVRVREGELDRNFPGDVDNDGLVESYGFQVIRLTNGRATFTVYPQERPLFYPVYLFTVPASERETLQLKNSRLLVNIDGKQFADPPQFPDGSFLLQLPYVIDRPVQVEAIVVPK